MDRHPEFRAHDGRSVVVFDLGGVLIDWDPRLLYRTMFDGDEAAMETFLATVCTPEWNARQDAGRPFVEGVARLVEEFPSERERIVAFHERWPETLGEQISGTVALLEELHERAVPLYALSNWSAETFPIARARFPFLGLFEGIVISGEELVSKPDPRLYQVLFDRHRLDPPSSSTTHPGTSRSPPGWGCWGCSSPVPRRCAPRSRRSGSSTDRPPLPDRPPRRGCLRGGTFRIGRTGR
jgi:2-haloacid dehalogenase